VAFPAAPSSDQQRRWLVGEQELRASACRHARACRQLCCWTCSPPSCPG